MKEQGLLYGPWAEDLPNWQFVDVEGKPAVTSDFTVPTEGLEAPWGMAQIIFYHDTARLAEPPRSIPALLDWARANPGRFAYPQPPDFLGSTFLRACYARAHTSIISIGRWKIKKRKRKDADPSGFGNHWP